MIKKDHNPIRTNMHPAESKPVSITKLIVSVHGIGDQKFCDTMQKTVSQFCRHFNFVPHFHPLGGFQSDKFSAPTIWRPAATSGSAFASYGFSEVYWADIPREVVKQGYLLEEAKEWASTVAKRASQVHNGDGVIPDLVSQVVSEAIETIGVLERLTSLAARAGLPKVDLNRILEDYLDDVQLMADYEPWRGRVVTQFQTAMGSVWGRLTDLERQTVQIYIIAHSEGTVVSLLGLLEAARKQGEKSQGWLKNVCGFMTIGSPIDKHLTLWPDLFKDPVPSYTGNPIEWRNYYDYGDPVGFELDQARKRVKKDWINLFSFPENADMGFSRYLVPGAAHNDYWEDADVFDHFIKDVVATARPNEGQPPAKPKNKLWAYFTSYFVAFAIPVLLLAVGVYFLYSAIADYRDLRPMENEWFYRAVCISSIVSLLAGVTALSRMQRIMGFAGQIKRLTGKGQEIKERWRLLQVLLAPLMPFACFYGLSRLARHISDIYSYPDWIELFSPFGGPDWVKPLPVIGISILLSFVVAVWTRARPQWGMKPLILGGGVCIAAIAFWLMTTSHNENPENPKIWPTLVSGAAFLYLWWLAALIFDLVFIWHRYIRCSTALKILGGKPVSPVQSGMARA
jgi:hypothetical protein